MKCGLEKGGARAAEKGVCPASTFELADGYLGGDNAGRACPFVSGTLCMVVRSAPADGESKGCVSCPFFKKLVSEHGDDFGPLEFACHIQNSTNAIPESKSAS